MNCPKCGWQMEKVVYQSVEIDRCENCKGLWFDMLEQEDLKNLGGSERIDVGDAKVGKEYNKMGNIRCPTCNVDIIRMVDNEQPHIWYESCPVCYGVFFDAGEFRDYKEHNFVDRLKAIFSKERK